MNFLARRRWKKNVQQAQHVVRHALNMREDIAPAEHVAAARAADGRLEQCWAARDWAAMEAACEEALAAAEQLLPPHPFPKWRENVEVLVVAIALAMACRTYFIQPFKIPTGSMQPTLNGVTATPQDGQRWYDRLPFNLVGLALFGERYVEVRARNSGRMEYAGIVNDQFTASGWSCTVAIGHAARQRPSGSARSMKLHAAGNAWQRPTDRPARTAERPYFVNKVKYNYSVRGADIVVLTPTIPGKERLGIVPNSFYQAIGGTARRNHCHPRAALGGGWRGDTAPEPFQRLVQDAISRLCHAARRAAQRGGIELPVGEKQFCRLATTPIPAWTVFWPVTEQALVGPSFFVYWPLGAHWGPRAEACV